MVKVRRSMMKVSKLIEGSLSVVFRYLDLTNGTSRNWQNDDNNEELG